MNKIITLLLFFQYFSYSQDNYEVKNNILYFNLEIPKRDAYLSDLKNHPKINMSQVRFSSKENKARCQGISIFMREEFNFEFSIQEKDSTYGIKIFNIRFINEIGNEKNTLNTTSVEEYLINNKGSVKNGSQSIKNLKCLNNYFLSIFNI